MVAEELYRYEEMALDCDDFDRSWPGVQVTTAWVLKEKDPEQLKAAISLYGPVNVGIN